MAKRFQTKMASSRIALPTSAFLAVIVFVVTGGITHQWWLQLGLVAATTYLLAELNNFHSLLRTYSRMVSCSFLALMCIYAFLFSDIIIGITALSTTLMYTFMFQCYQYRNAVNMTYLAFLSIGMCSMFFVHILYFVPLLWISMAIFLFSMTLRTFMASLVGLITPYWFAVLAYVYLNRIGDLTAHFTALAEFRPLFDYTCLSENSILTFIFVVVLFIIGTTHYIRQNYQDKIKIRMFYNIFILISLAAIIFIILQPQHYNALMGVLMISVSPIIGHFVALTSTRFTNIGVIALLAAVVLLTVYNLWSGILSNL